MREFLPWKEVAENSRGVGLSATVGNPDEVANWMSDGQNRFWSGTENHQGNRTSRNSTAEDDLLAGEWAISPKSIAALRHLAQTLIEDSPSLVFVNSRSTAETVAQRLASIVPEIKLVSIMEASQQKLGERWKKLFGPVNYMD